MPINKVVSTLDEAIAGINDGSSLFVSGFGEAGSPTKILDHLSKQQLQDLTVISNNAGTGTTGLAALLAAGSVRKIICSYPRSAGSVIFEDLYSHGKIDLELCPQGTLSERIRASGAGIAGFFTPTAADTALGMNREHRSFAGRDHILELALSADFALIRAQSADRWGNLIYSKSARNFGPTMAMAGHVTIAEVDNIVTLGDLDPEAIVTPGIFVQRVVRADAS
jgi:3-oxoadipate CoA-transferase alpha subunit